ncbi:MAG: PilZ domain-containing protein [Sandaracinaceae bacterium]
MTTQQHTAFASILTPPTAGTWNVLLERRALDEDDDRTVIDARPLGLRVPLVEPERLERHSQPCRQAPAEAYLEVALAPYSESNLVADLDGRVQGVFVATYRELAVGTPVEAQLCLPGGVQLTARATVTWSRAERTGRPGLGLQLERLDASDADLLQTFAAYREPELYV